MGWSRVKDPSEVVKVGEDITVRVLKVDEDGQKISLGLKQLTADPWSTVPDRFAVGQVVNARVTRVADFGAFVELEPGIEALAHASTFAATGRRDGWTSQVKVGTTAAFEILTIDTEKKRIGVSLVPEGSARGSAEVREYTERENSAAAAEGFGSLADKLRGALSPPSRKK
jgi:small subunit ribosomal protein S1